MKTIQARTAAAFLIVAGSVIPAFAQGEGNRYGRSRDGGNRPQQSQQQSRGESRQGGGYQDGGQQYRQRESQPQNRQQPQYQQRQAPSYSQQQYRPQQEQRYSQQRYSQQQYRAPQYRAPQYQQQYRDNYRGGRSSYGYQGGGGGMRWASRGGYRGQYIPNTRFYSSFGRQNYFRFGRPVYYNGYQRYSYGGYGFRIFDPIPAYWGDDWYDSDDVYVDYEDDGYYMYNRSYPGVGIAIGIDF